MNKREKGEGRKEKEKRSSASAADESPDAAGRKRPLDKSPAVLRLSTNSGSPTGNTAKPATAV
jgi:hypothetical protein